MVKHFKKPFFVLFLFCTFSFLNSCNIDLLGLFTSNDLNQRLIERNNLTFLDSMGWSSLSLDDEYSFIVLADTHIEDGNAFGLEGLADVITANTGIKFAVILGDITQHGAAQDIDKFIEIASSLTVPCFPVIGNHDIYFNNWSVWKEKIGSTSYRIDGGNTSLFMLDSANSFFGNEQLNWLEEELKTANERIFVFTHAPLFVTGPVDMQQVTNINERARIVSILRNKCDIMFMGHSHKRFYHEAGNVKYITLEDFIEKKAYCIVTVTKDGISYTFGNL
jgi:predicted phosphodiesterase